MGFDAARLLGAKGFARIHALADAVEAVYTDDESKRRFEILCRQVFIRFKALLMEPAALAYAERHDNLEAIYKKLSERRDTADVSELLITRNDLSKTDREMIKQASRDLLAALETLISPLDRWTEKEQTQAEVETFILDNLYQLLPEPPYTGDDKQRLAGVVYRHVWQHFMR